MRRFALFVLPTLILLLLLPVVAAAAPNATARFDRNLEGLYAQGYPQALEQYFVSLGTNPDLGFRWAGTAAERAVAIRTLMELKAAGLRGVKLETVPVDVFNFKSAGVTAGGQTYVASSFAGTPPTGPAGVTADVIYVGSGAKAAFDAAEAAYGPVAGKLVLMDLDFATSIWMNLPGAEAALRGALGVITTYGDGGYFWYADDALGSFDATYNMDWAPMVYISKTDGDVLRTAVKAANDEGTPYEATMVCDTDVTLADNGGTAYNVIATLPGSVRDGQANVISAHLDAHFRAGMDDTAALVNMITIAKAMRASGYKPAHDIIFLATAGEEFGYTNCYYDWLAGSWYAATHTHKDWAGKVRAFIGLELMGLKDAKLRSNTSEELVGMLGKVAADNPDLVPYGANFTSPVYCWNDQWPFAAEGIPGISFGTSNDTYLSLYHTNYETSALVDYGYLAKIAKFVFRTQGALDSGLLPYDLSARADTLAASIDGSGLAEAGAAPATVNRLFGDVAAFVAAAGAFDDAAAAGTVTDVTAANKALLAVETTLNDELIALDCWDSTIYPHEQVFADLKRLNTALAELDKDPVDPDAATAPLWDVAQMYYGLTFSYPAFVEDQKRHDPGYYRIAWGGQGQLAPYLDLIAEYNAIYAGQYVAARAGLQSAHDLELLLLNKRLARMADVLEVVTPQIAAITP
ncbi:MAG: M28 family peptidase [Actinomycetes bacterium]